MTALVPKSIKNSGPASGPRGLDLANSLNEMANGVSDAMSDAVGAAAEGVKAAVDGVGPAVGAAGQKAAEVTKDAVGAGVKELTRWGRIVERGWRFVERASNPPWTREKVLGWVAFGLLVVLAALINRQFQTGALTMPGADVLAGGFISWVVSTGPLGLFFFMAVSTLFFVFLPSEPIFFVLLVGSGQVVTTVLVAAAGSALGACANYWIGARFRHRRIAKKGEEAKISKWGARARSKGGATLLVVAAALPVPEVFALAYGLADFPFKKFAVLALAGRLIKWTWITAAFLLFDASF